MESEARFNSSERFTEATATAVAGFQLKYAKEILAPLGLANPTGYVGPSTRRVLNRLYGCNRVIPPIPGNLPSTISGVSGPTTRDVGQVGTWTVRASDPENGPLSYSVIWGDEAPTASGVAYTPTMEKIQQTATLPLPRVVLGELAGLQIRALIVTS